MSNRMMKLLAEQEAGRRAAQRYRRQDWVERLSHDGRLHVIRTSGNVLYKDAKTGHIICLEQGSEPRYTDETMAHLTLWVRAVGVHVPFDNPQHAERDHSYREAMQRRSKG